MKITIETKETTDGGARAYRATVTDTRTGRQVSTLGGTPHEAAENAMKLQAVQNWLSPPTAAA
ncbi:MAG TPA: hypothetical protein VKA19_09630 [Alphaproteobacteria bacterium]|nr:hypothetical protein [Alphaproteobacteria bacterium]